jgi:predicted nucleic acid-binding Zn ribbon protein
MPNTRKCERCGKSIDLLPAGEITCNDEKCRNMVTRNIAICAVCGKPFEKARTAVTCSDECKKVYISRERKAKRALAKKRRETLGRSCRICGQSVKISSDDDICENPECRLAEEQSYVKCIVCGTRFKKTRTTVTCSKECRKIRLRTLKRDRIAKIRAKKNNKRPDRKCIYCGDTIDRGKRNWNLRIYCHKKECKAKMELRARENQRRSHRKAYVKEKCIEEEVTSGVRTEGRLYNTNHEDYFDHLMFLRKMKKISTTNGKTCKDCGCALQGSFHKRCGACMEKKCRGAARHDGNYLFDSSVNSVIMSTRTPKTRHSS